MGDSGGWGFLECGGNGWQAVVAREGLRALLPSSGTPGGVRGFATR